MAPPALQTPWNKCVPHVLSERSRSPENDKSHQRRSGSWNEEDEIGLGLTNTQLGGLAEVAAIISTLGCNLCHNRYELEYPVFARGKKSIQSVKVSSKLTLKRRTRLQAAG
jgi:hypothetical protein